MCRWQQDLEAGGEAAGATQQRGASQPTRQSRSHRNKGVIKMGEEMSLHQLSVLVLFQFLNKIPAALGVTAN